MTSMTYIVAAYDCSQRYGGPEEGGWWYDSGQLVRALRIFRNEDLAYAWSRRINAKLHARNWGPNAGKHSYTSVLSEGEVQAQVCEHSVPDHFPESRPRYE